MERLGNTKTSTKANKLIKTGKGYLNTVTISQDDVAPTAGTIEISDSLDGASGVFFKWNVLTTTFLPFSIRIEAEFSTGLYVKFTTTADVNVLVSYN